MVREGVIRESVLVVDDDATIRELIQRILSVEGFENEVAASAEEALDLLGRKTYGLCLLDICMQGMNGLELLKRIRQDWPEMQVVMATGVNERETALEALEEGAVGYVIKPFDQIELLVNVSNALRLRQLEDANRTRREELEAEVEQRTADLVESHRKMVEQEKLASVWQLAAGVAHEVNNPTGYIASNLASLQKYLARIEEYIAAQQQVIDQGCQAAQVDELKLLKRKLKIDAILEDIDEVVADSLEGTERIRRIVLGLKNFSRKDAEESQQVDINLILEETLTLCWNELKYKATVERDFGDVPQIMGRAQKLSQAFLNLLVNASQAIEEQGTIRIRSRLVGEKIEVEISDTGCGIPQDALQKIFEPFYTTKDVGVGTGLGLAIVQEIVGLHQGDLRIESEVGAGTTFTISLPIHSG